MLCDRVDSYTLESNNSEVVIYHCTIVFVVGWKSIQPICIFCFCKTIYENFFYKNLIKFNEYFKYSREIFILRGWIDAYKDCVESEKESDTLRNSFAIK